MIPSGVEVYVASTPVDFRKGPVSLMALVRDGGVDPFKGALYVFRRPGEDRLVGRRRYLPVCENAREGAVLLAPDCSGDSATELCPVARPCRRDGLEKGSADNGAASAIGWLEKGCDILNRGI